MSGTQFVDRAGSNSEICPPLPPYSMKYCKIWMKVIHTNPVWEDKLSELLCTCEALGTVLEESDSHYFYPHSHTENSNTYFRILNKRNPMKLSYIVNNLYIKGKLFMLHLSIFSYQLLNLTRYKDISQVRPSLVSTASHKQGWDSRKFKAKGIPKSKQMKSYKAF